MKVIDAIPRIIVGLRTTQPDALKNLSPNMQDGIALLARIDQGEYDAYAYVTNVSLFVYYTTLFDTFVQDTIEFLLCLHPGAMGESAVAFERILKAKIARTF